VETFRDLSDQYHDYERARKIQSAALGQPLPADGRVSFATRYVPRDIVGGDCYRITRLEEDRYGFFVADVSGHGVAGALYTMFLLSLWEDNRHLLATPARFAEAVNRKLCGFASGEAFATAVCGLLDTKHAQLTLACCGGPLPHLFRGSQVQPLGGPGLPWGLTEAATYEETRAELAPRDRLLLFTDGATEIQMSGDKQIDTQGLLAALRQLDYPHSDLDFHALERALLERSNRIRFDDDVTFLEVRLP
jgi:phosphoserine phosphatase RsbU/P